MADKLRYSDDELEEFRQIIDEKLSLARRDYDQMMRVLMNQDSNDVDDTSPTYKALEEGSATQTKEVNDMISKNMKRVNRSPDANTPTVAISVMMLNR